MLSFRNGRENWGLIIMKCSFFWNWMVDVISILALTILELNGVDVHSNAFCLFVDFIFSPNCSFVENHSLRKLTDLWGGLGFALLIFFSFHFNFFFEIWNDFVRNWKINWISNWILLFWELSSEWNEF